MAQWPLADWWIVFAVTAALLVMAATDWQAQWICPLCLTGLFPLYYLFGQLHLNELLFVMLPLLFLLAIAAKQELLGAGDGEFLAVLLVTVGVFNSGGGVMIASASLLTYVAITGGRQRRLPFIPWLALGTSCLLIKQLL
jgi:hypothetical protein